MRANDYSTRGSTAPEHRRFSPLLRLLPFLRRYAARWLLAFVALTVAAGAMLTLPVAFRNLIDFGFAIENRGHIDRYFVGLFGVASVLAVATAARFYLVSWLGERITADLRSAVYAHVVRMSPAWFETTRTGEVLSRLTTDTTLVQTVVGTTLSMGLRNLFLMAGGTVMLAVTSLRLTGYILATVVLVVVPIVVFGRRVRRLSRASQDRVADASALAGETLSAMTTVQAFGREGVETGRFAAAVERAFAAALARVRARSALTLAVILLVFGAVVFVLWLGAHAVLAGRMTMGELGQFVLYAVVTAGAFGAIAEVWGDLQRAAGASERLTELLAATSPVEEPAAPVALPRAGRAIAVRDVTFRYPSRPDRPAIDGVSLAVGAGEHVALVGPSGAGKSTLFQLLLRFYDPQSGSIAVDGVDIRRLSFADLRRTYGVVLQDSAIFAASALDNIRFGRPEASREEVVAAAQVAAAHEFICALPEGYDTFLGERGVRLSGGQRQRIAIARAILVDPPVLLLDEATSALDAESERQVQRALDNASRDRATLVIAHRLATVLKADRIVVLDEGRVVAQGTHAELLLSSPLYARLAALQLAGAAALPG